MELWQIAIVWSFMISIPLMVGIIIMNWASKYFETSFEDSPIIWDYHHQKKLEETKKRLKENRIQRLYKPEKFV